MLRELNTNEMIMVSGGFTDQEDPSDPLYDPSRDFFDFGSEEDNGDGGKSGGGIIGRIGRAIGGALRFIGDLAGIPEDLDTDVRLPDGTELDCPHRSHPVVVRDNNGNPVFGQGGVPVYECKAQTG